VKPELLRVSVPGGQFQKEYQAGQILESIELTHFTLAGVTHIQPTWLFVSRSLVSSVICSRKMHLNTCCHPFLPINKLRNSHDWPQAPTESPVITKVINLGFGHCSHAHDCVTIHYPILLAISFKPWEYKQKNICCLDFVKCTYMIIHGDFSKMVAP